MKCFSTVETQANIILPGKQDVFNKAIEEECIKTLGFMDKIADSIRPEDLNKKFFQTMTNSMNMSFVNSRNLSPEGINTKISPSFPNKISMTSKPSKKKIINFKSPKNVNVFSKLSLNESKEYFEKMH